jgi:hypothetical protein
MSGIKNYDEPSEARRRCHVGVNAAEIAFRSAAIKAVVVSRRGNVTSARCWKQFVPGDVSEEGTGGSAVIATEITRHRAVESPGPRRDLPVFSDRRTERGRGEE